MSDPRHFAKLDLGYFDNPKIADFLDDRPRVMILHLRAILYCRQHLTDGLFPIRNVVRLACGSYCGSQCDGQCDFCAAVHARLFLRRNAREAIVHDYLEHQDSAEQVRARKSAGQSGAAARWSKKGDADRIANRNADANAEKRREEKSLTRDADAIAADFDEWYRAYPRKRDRGHALKAYKSARKKVSHQTLLEAVEAQRDELTAKGSEFTPYAATWLNGERWTDESGEVRQIVRPVNYRNYDDEASA